MNKIFDTFLYYDEDLMLEIRLNILNNYVDYFVILECDHDFNGKYKGFNFDLNKFSKFQEKIIFIKYSINKSIINKNKDPWFIHDSSRDEIFSKLKIADEEDFIIHSDADEIPNPLFLNKNNLKNKIYIFEQKMFFFKFNFLETEHFWLKSKMCKKKYIKSLSWLRWVKGKKYSYLRADTYFRKYHQRNIEIVKDGGWHFSYIKPLEEIKKKLNSVIEEGHNQYTDEFLKTSVEKGFNFLNRNKTYLSKVKLDQTFPSFLLKNIDKYKEFIA